VSKGGAFLVSGEVALSTIHRTGMPTAFHGAAATGHRRVARIAVRFEGRVPEGTLACGLLRSIEAHNPGSAGHAIRVCRLAREIARMFPLPGRAITTITAAALLHDIGKLAIDAEILRKPGSLTDAERATMRLHVPAGVRLVRAIPALCRAAVLIRASHEWLNGAGYPRGLRGDAIPLGSRIITVADAFDALTHARVYHTPLSPAHAVAQLKRSAGSQFDPRVLRALGQIVLSGPRPAVEALVPALAFAHSAA
jgi:HD-GYP domain-containing protein (c-di-GMP phosphodiesterase class II)